MITIRWSSVSIEKKCLSTSCNRSRPQLKRTAVRLDKHVCQRYLCQRLPKVPSIFTQLHTQTHVYGSTWSIGVSHFIINALCHYTDRPFDLLLGSYVIGGSDRQYINLRGMNVYVLPDEL